jgi:hypothetical protein
MLKLTHLLPAHLLERHNSVLKTYFNLSNVFYLSRLVDLLEYILFLGYKLLQRLPI